MLSKYIFQFKMKIKLLEFQYFHWFLKNNVQKYSDKNIWLFNLYSAFKITTNQVWIPIFGGKYSNIRSYTGICSYSVSISNISVDPSCNLNILAMMDFVSDKLTNGRKENAFYLYRYYLSAYRHKDGYKIIVCILNFHLTDPRDSQKFR